MMKKLAKEKRLTQDLHLVNGSKGIRTQACTVFPSTMTFFKYLLILLFHLNNHKRGKEKEVVMFL